MKTLDSLSAGESGVVLRVEGESRTVVRLAAMGVAEGRRVRLVKKVFFGNTLLAESDGNRFAVRKSGAKKIFVSPLPASDAKKDGPGATP